MKRIGRRQFIQASLSGLALATLPKISFAQSNPDVVVIGAGAAGLAATAELMKKGKSVICIEAMGRIGGRVYTDNFIFGVPYDMGAHWLDGADGHPIVKYAKKNEKFKIWPNSSDNDQVFDGRSATSGNLWKIYKNIKAIKSITKQDVAIIKKLTQEIKDKDWFDTAHLISGPYGMARDFNNWSCYDDYHWKGPDGSGFCKQGYGALVADYRKDVPVKLKTVAKEIKWDKKGVKVITNDGTISAKACIVTVSTGVLNARKIKFTPDLPAYKYEAFAGITMGTYNHITFLFDKKYLFKLGIKYPDTYIYTKIQSNGAPSPKGGCGLFNITGSGLCYWDTGGNFSEELEAEGSKAQIDFFLNVMKKTFGSEISKHVIKAHATRWGKNPFTLGSYAGAIPGKAKKRTSLRRSIGKRIFFAGEACSKAHATVYGANDSGTRVGKKVAKKV